MGQFKRPEFLESWVGKVMMGVIVIGLVVGIGLPLQLKDALTYWMVFVIVAALLLPGMIVGSIIQKCWGYAGLLSSVLAIMVMVFFRVLYPNI